jgi:alcohol dehydrogenase
MFNITKKFGKLTLVFSPKVINIPKPMTLTGEGSSLQLCENIANLGMKKVQIVSDKVLNDIGVLAPLAEKLESCGAQVVIFDGVKPDPTHGVVTQCIEHFHANNCDAILAIGGGSSIDAAKIVALATANNKTSRQLVGLLRGRKIKPFFAIPTTAGTGSEATLGAVVSDDETHQKGIVLNPKTVPLMVALDAGIMSGMPPKITAETGMDALTHAVEAYISEVNTVESDLLARAAVKMVFEHLPVAYKEPKNMQARDAMAQASHYGGVALNQGGLGYVHGIAHQLGANYGVPHGLANSIVMPHVLQFSLSASAARLGELARVIGVASDSDSDEIAAQAFVDAVKQLIVDLNINTAVPGIDAQHFPAMAKAAFKEAHNTYAVPKYMKTEDCVKILQDIAA